jgi:DNA-binding PadR family transcriptional regulator
MANQYLGTFEQVVLLALAGIEGEADGMSVVDAIESATGRELSVPAVYVTLKRLTKKGLVRSAVRIEEGDGPPARKYFALEPAGIEELSRAKTMLDSLWARVRLEELAEKA